MAVAILVGGGEGGSGGAVVAAPGSAGSGSPKFAPHFPQNLVPSSALVPHFGQNCAMFAPSVFVARDYTLLPSRHDTLRFARSARP